ncbi:hypothetical protein CDD83_8464 [Cordyceps sp. RAO-2017]|nr:hypothetical protein CDD83_8464 [Cordyceps sp. RAO-2017]
MRLGNHIGKQVLRINQDTEAATTTTMISKARAVKLDPQATYVLADVGESVGLLGVYLADQGAKHLALLSRPGAVSSTTTELLRQLETRRVQARVFTCDIGNEDSLAAVLQSIREELPPVRGLVQGAMILKDGPFYHMSYEEWAQATWPKVDGSWNLHKLLPTDLDFFILLSSCGGIIGSISQSNQAAGSTFQDALIHHRRSMGLKANAVDVGLVEDASHPYRQPAKLSLESYVGQAPITGDQFVAIVGAIMAPGSTDSPTPAQLVIGAGTAEARARSQQTNENASLPWLSQDIQFSYLAQVGLKAQGAPSRTSPQQDHGERLRRARSIDEAAAVVKEMMTGKLSRIMMRPESEIDTVGPLQQSGFDSLAGAEMRNWLSQQLHCEISLLELMAMGSLTKAAEEMAKKSGLVAESLRGSSGSSGPGAE